MKLTKEDRADLKKLYDSRGFKILLKIFEEKKTDLLNKFYTADLWQEKTRLDLNATQNHIKWMEEIIKTVKWNSQEKIETIKSLR